MITVEAASTHFENTRMTPSSRNTLQLLAVGVIVMVLAALVFRQLERPRITIPDGARLTQLDVLPLANGARPIAQADLAGKVVLINFWGTWCPPCLAEFPQIEALGKQYRDRKDFLLLSVSSSGHAPEDITGLRDSTAGFLSLSGYKTPVYADPMGTTRDGFRMIPNFDGYPATVLIDREGRIVGAWLGYNEGEFEQIKLQIAAMVGR